MTGTQESQPRLHGSIVLYRKVAGIFRNKTVSIVFRILLTAAFFVLVNKSISLDDITTLNARVEPVGLTCAVLLGIAGFYFQVVRWHVVLQAMGLSCRGTIPLKTMLWGNFLGFLTPGRIGELFRGLTIDPARKTDSVFAVFIDRLFAIAMVMIAGVLFIVIQALLLKVPLHLIETVSAGILCALAVAVIVAYKMKNVLAARFAGKVWELLYNLKKVLTVRVAVISAAAHACLLLQTMVLLRMFGVTGWFTNCVISGLAYLQMIFLPFFIANVGVREYSFGVYIKLLAGNAGAGSIAFGVSSIILFVNIILPALAGLVWFFFDKKKDSGTKPSSDTQT